MKLHKLFSKKKLLIAVPIVAILLIIIFNSLTSTNSDKNKHQSKIFVNVSTVKRQDVTVNTDAIGNVQPHATVAIKSLVDGELLTVNFKEGDSVKAGQILFTIDPRPYQIKLQQAKAALTRDQAQLALANTTLDRNLLLSSKGYISKQEIDQLKANQLALSATIQADQAAVNNAQLNLNYCSIQAPISGRTGSITVTPGNIVKSTDQTSLVTINQIAPIDVKFSISEKEFLTLKQNLNQEKISIQAYLEQNNKIVKIGTLSFADNTVDTTTGMIQLKALFANTDQYFWPGQFVKVIIPLTQLKQAIVIPTRAVQMGQNGAYVFVVKNNTVSIRAVIVGPSVNENTVITSGLQPDEQVVTEGQLYLTDGAKVQIAK